MFGFMTSPNDANFLFTGIGSSPSLSTSCYKTSVYNARPYTTTFLAGRNGFGIAMLVSG